MSQYSTVHYNTVQYSTVQYSTIQCSTVKYSTVCYSALLVFVYQLFWLPAEVVIITFRVCFVWQCLLIMIFPLMSSITPTLTITNTKVIASLDLIYRRREGEDSRLYFLFYYYSLNHLMWKLTQWLMYPLSKPKGYRKFIINGWVLDLIKIICSYHLNYHLESILEIILNFRSLFVLCRL